MFTAVEKGLYPHSGMWVHVYNYEHDASAYNTRHLHNLKRSSMCYGAVFVGIHTSPDGTKAFPFKGFLCRGNLMGGGLLNFCQVLPRLILPCSVCGAL